MDTNLATERQVLAGLSETEWLAERECDLTSTNTPALFGLSPYQTRFELWQEKAGVLPREFKATERMRWGNRLEAAIAHTVAEQRGWAIRPMKEYIRLPGERIGSSFDFRVQRELGVEVCLGDAQLVAADGPDDALLEIKNVDWLAFKNGWKIDGDWIEAPDHIELQVQHELMVSGLRKAYIAVLVGGNDIRILERDADEQAFMAIRSEAAAFWQSIADNTPPPPVMPDDADALIRLHSFAEPGRLLDVRGDAEIATLVRQLNAWKKEAQHAEEEATALKAQLLERIGDAEKVLVDGFKISAGMVAPSPGTLVTPDMVGTYIGARKGFRSLRVTAAK